MDEQGGGEGAGAAGVWGGRPDDGGFWVGDDR